MHSFLELNWDQERILGIHNISYTIHLTMITLLKYNNYILYNIIYIIYIIHFHNTIMGTYAYYNITMALTDVAISIAGKRTLTM